MIISRLLK